MLKKTSNYSENIHTNTWINIVSSRSRDFKNYTSIAMRSGIGSIPGGDKFSPSV